MPLTLCILKRVMYVYLLWLTVSNLCALVTAVPVFFHGYYGLHGDGTYSTALYQVYHLVLSCLHKPSCSGSGSSHVAHDQFVLCQLCVHHHLHHGQPVHRHLQAICILQNQHIGERQALHQYLLHLQHPPPHPLLLQEQGGLQGLLLKPLQYVHQHQRKLG